jgi:GNAT superfamily N-acetyltransferase
MNLSFRIAKSTDLNRCTAIRGLTRDNALDKDTLEAIGVTEENWAPKMHDGIYVGFVAEDQNEVVAFCFGDTQTGEVMVLAVLPGFEGTGVGRKLLSLIVDKLLSSGFSELWLAASADPKIRAHGFYRHLGWQPTQTFDDNGDEILKYKKVAK